jgi:four helix bundle protein
MCRALRAGMDRPEMEARSAKFARQVAEFANRLRGRPGATNAADQLADCSSSAAANYRAAGRARSRKEFVSKLGIANEEADESVYWLEHIAGTALGNGFDLKSLEREARELRAIIARSYATAKRRSGGKK